MRNKSVCCFMFAIFFATFYSCSESIDLSIEEHVQIDSIVVHDTMRLEMAAGDTVSIEVTVYPNTVSLDSEMVTSHSLFLQKEEAGGGKSESSAYKITRVEKASLGDGNYYRLFIVDTDAGYGYRDTVYLCFKNEHSIVRSTSFEIRNAGTSLYRFALYDGRTLWEAFNVKNDTIQIQVPNDFDLKKATAIFKHNGTGVYINKQKQNSGEDERDFSDFCNPLIYTVAGFDADESNYTIEVFNLPIIYINTPNNTDISSRYKWQENCSFIVRDTNGTIEDYGEAKVKGRGNWTWREGLVTGKKPYAIKLAQKPKDRNVLGMPGHKRWVLLSNPVSFLPNPVGFEVNRRTETCKWAPRSRYVELILNGKHQGLYLLCEQIRIDKNRVNIKEMKGTDIEGESLTGGYLISYDDANEDDDPTYYTKYYNMPFMIKNPDTDDINTEQRNYITNYLNEAELSLFDDERFQNGAFYEYFDVDSWIDYFFAAELWGALEMKRPRSVWLYKDRGGKLTAGPLWDLESNFFHKQQLYSTEALYYGRFLQSSKFVGRMKEKWYQFRSNILGNEKYDGIISYIDSLYMECHYAADRDRKMIPESFEDLLPYPESKIDYEYQTIHDNILVKLDWVEQQIMSW